MIQSPLNYTGGKAKLLPQILPLFPRHIAKFVDLFCGGCNVGINVTADTYIYNDSEKHIIELFKYFRKKNTKELINDILNLINEYGLSLSSKNSYEYYGCNSSDGLGTFNRDAYNKLRQDINESICFDDDYYLKLYILIVYAFNNQIRYNSNGEFNLPVGKRDFNDKMESKLYLFVNELKKQKCRFSNKDFRKISPEKLSKNDFVYADPPYYITCASYNENGGWKEKDEKDLLLYLDELNKHEIRFALSNVLENKGKKNEILLKWISERPDYVVHHLSFSYSNSNYHSQNKDAKTDEVLITNY